MPSRLGTQEMEVSPYSVFDRHYDISVSRKRFVLEPISGLNRTKKSELRDAALAVVFSVPFLEHYGKQLSRTERELSNLCNRAQKTFESLKLVTVSDLLAKKYDELRSIAGLGERTMALILDTLTLFGLSLKSVPALAENTESDLEKKAVALATKIGFTANDE